MAAFTNGNSHVFKWLLGLLSVIVGGVTIWFHVWLIQAVVKNDKDNALLELRVGNLEQKINKQR